MKNVGIPIAIVKSQRRWEWQRFQAVFSNRDGCSGKKKAHKHKLFGPVGLGTTPGLSQKQTRFVPGTNPGFPLILHSGNWVCPREKPGLSLGKTLDRRATEKFMC